MTAYEMCAIMCVVDGAIHAAAGADYLRYEEYDFHGGEAGEVKETRGYVYAVILFTDH